MCGTCTCESVVYWDTGNNFRFCEIVTENMIVCFIKIFLYEKLKVLYGSALGVINRKVNGISACITCVTKEETKFDDIVARLSKKYFL